MLRLQRFPGWICLLALSTLVACGYRSTLGGGPAGGHADGTGTGVPSRIAVVALRSDSPEPWLDRIVTDALRREVGGRARLRLTDDVENAELEVRGRIRPLETSSRSFSSFVAALEYSLTLELDLEVHLASGDVVKLDPTMLSETESYLASPDVEITRTNRLEALRRLSDQIASRVADTIELIERPIPEGSAGEGG
jgi:Lipopolysaccharide-assembly